MEIPDVVATIILCWFLWILLLGVVGFTYLLYKLIWD